MCVLFPEYLPNIFLRIEFWAVWWQILHLERSLMSPAKILDKRALMVGSSIQNHDDVSIDSFMEILQEIGEGLLIEIGSLNSESKLSGCRDCAKYFYSLLAAKGRTLGTMSDTCPGRMNGSLGAQADLVLEEDVGPLFFARRRILGFSRVSQRC